MLKKSVSMLLVVVMMFSVFSITASATEENSTANSQNAAITNDDISTAGTTSFGNMLSDKIDEKSSELEKSGNHISDIEVTDTLASVTFDALEDCTILVGIFDETNDQLIASGKAEVTKDDKTVDVVIETDAMPQYFVVKGYMLDYNNSPVATAYSSPLYTESIQKIKNLNASDFAPEEVLNLDGKDETNFAVYSDSTIIIDYEDGYNVPELVDNGNGKYIFTNATEQMKSLKSSDVFSYSYSATDVLIVKIDTITIDGSTVTITQKNASLEDAFEYVKIESNADSSDCEVDTSTVSDGITYVGKNQSEIASLHNRGAIADTTFTNEMKLSYSIPGDKESSAKPTPDGAYGEGEAKINIKGTMDLSLALKLNLYVSYEESYVSFSVDYKSDITLSIEAKISGEFCLGSINLYPILGLCFYVKPVFVYEISTKVTIGATLKGSVGITCSSENGIQDTSKNPTLTFELKIEGEVFLGLKLQPGINLIGGLVADASVSCTVGARATAKYCKPFINESLKGEDVKHACNNCIQGDIKFEFKLSAKVTLLNCIKFDFEILGIEEKLTDFYYSFDYDEFGWTTCPHLKYKVTFNVTKNGKVFNGAKLYNGKEVTDEELGSTYDDGTLTTYLTPGVHYINVGTVVKKVEITEEDRKFILDVSNERNCKLFGRCGANCYWELADDGTMYIYGVGIMDSYRYDAVLVQWAPWTDYADKIKSVIIQDGITAIGSRSFEGCDNLVNIKISKTVNWIGGYAFANCDSLTQITIPKNVTYIFTRILCRCPNLDKVVIYSSKEQYIDYQMCYGSKVNSIYFIGDMPKFNPEAFNPQFDTYINVCYYPYNNDTWTKDAMDIAGYYGHINWQPYDPATIADAKDTADKEKSAVSADFSISNLKKANISENLVSANNTLSAEFRNLNANEDYFIVAVKSSTADDILSADNLLYFTQQKADENGNISFIYVPRVSGYTNPTVIAYSVPKKNIRETDVSIGEMYYTGNSQTPDYSIRYNGTPLEKDVDYTVTGDLSVTKAGKYSLTFTGINNFSGTFTKEYIVYDFYRYGDVDMDGYVTINDVTTLQRYLAGSDSLSDNAVLLADVDNSGNANISDATVLQYYLAGRAGSDCLADTLSSFVIK